MLASDRFEIRVGDFDEFRFRLQFMFVDPLFGSALEEESSSESESLEEEDELEEEIELLELLEGSLSASLLLLFDFDFLINLLLYLPR